jgi:hypothetical protein
MDSHLDKGKRIHDYPYLRETQQRERCSNCKKHV